MGRGVDRDTIMYCTWYDTRYNGTVLQYDSRAQIYVRVRMHTVNEVGPDRLQCTGVQYAVLGE